eukprot:3131090-Alexandrium_andersonii.AAC.1
MSASLVGSEMCIRDRSIPLGIRSEAVSGPRSSNIERLKQFHMVWGRNARASGLPSSTRRKQLPEGALHRPLTARTPRGKAIWRKLPAIGRELREGWFPSTASLQETPVG